VEDPVRDQVVIEAARREALRRGVGLQVVQVAREEQPPSLFPVAGVEVEVIVQPAGHVADALTDRSARSGLLVAGRHHRGRESVAPLGATVRDLLGECEVPVLLVAR
jgi:nucleotide-binding universal stress UspA family protein